MKLAIAIVIVMVSMELRHWRRTGPVALHAGGCMAGRFEATAAGIMAAKRRPCTEKCSVQHYLVS